MNPMGIPAQTIQHWQAMGHLLLPPSGTGRHQVWPVEECRAAAAIDAVRRLGGSQPMAGSVSPANVRLRNDAAKAARANPPGTLVELPCSVPWIRMLLVVP